MPVTSTETATNWQPLPPGTYLTSGLPNTCGYAVPPKVPCCGDGSIPPTVKVAPPSLD